MWLIFQSAIIILVLWSNIYWHWTPNTYLASAIGIGAAYLATLGLNAVARFVRKDCP